LIDRAQIKPFYFYVFTLTLCLTTSISETQYSSVQFLPIQREMPCSGYIHPICLNLSHNPTSPTIQMRTITNTVTKGLPIASLNPRNMMYDDAKRLPTIRDIIKMTRFSPFKAYTPYSILKETRS